MIVAAACPVTSAQLLNCNKRGVPAAPLAVCVH